MARHDLCFFGSEIDFPKYGINVESSIKQIKSNIMFIYYIRRTKATNKIPSGSSGVPASPAGGAPGQSRAPPAGPAGASLPPLLPLLGYLFIAGFAFCYILSFLLAGICFLLAGI